MWQFMLSSVSESAENKWFEAEANARVSLPAATARQRKYSKKKWGKGRTEQVTAIELARLQLDCDNVALCLW
jgi:hypothetical protein